MKLIKKLILRIILVIFLVIAYIVGMGYRMYDNAINDIDLQTKIIDIQSDKDFVYFKDLPDYYVKAVIDVEDQRFYLHKGIDLISIARAVITNIKSKNIVEGGSTITQQVAKNMYFTHEKKWERKVAELFVVHDLEQNYTKEEIFELYVNISYFGDGYYGIGEAAKGYFGKDVKELTLMESTLLAGIPNAPSVYAPTKNPDLAIERQKRVIRKMIDNKDLTTEEAEKLYNEIE